MFRGPLWHVTSDRTVLIVTGELDQERAAANVDEAALIVSSSSTGPI